MLSAQGYWFLAYSWQNYLVACNRCNSVHKNSLFPVLDEAKRRVPPKKVDVERETPMLMSCFGTLKPEDHLQFRKNGQIGKTNASDFGRHTIEVCGLDREQLRGDEAKEYAGMVRIIFTQRTKKSWTWLERQV